MSPTMSSMSNLKHVQFEVLSTLLKKAHHVMGKNHGSSSYHVQLLLVKKRYYIFKVLEYVDDSTYEGEVLLMSPNPQYW